MRLPLTCLLAAALLAGCGTTTRFVQTNPSPVQMRPRAPETVAVFTSAQPDQPFVEVGIVEAQQSSALSTDDMPQVIAALRQAAAERGCDGVIIVSSDDAVVGSTYRGTGGETTLKGYRGACIMFRPTAAAVRAAPEVNG